MANEQRIYSFWTNILAAIIGGTFLFLFLDSDDNWARLGFDITSSWLWLMFWDVVLRGKRRFSWKWEPEQPPEKKTR